MWTRRYQTRRKLTEFQVLRIRQLAHAHRERKALAEFVRDQLDLPVAVVTVRDIINNHTWVEAPL